MLNEAEEVSCETSHLEGRCEDCDVRRISRYSLEDVMDRFGEGRVTIAQFDAYRFVWGLLTPYDTYRHWANQPYVTDPDVCRIARKLCRARGIGIPDALVRSDPTRLAKPDETTYGATGDGDPTGGGPYLPGSAVES